MPGAPAPRRARRDLWSFLLPPWLDALTPGSVLEEQVRLTVEETQHPLLAHTGPSPSLPLDSFVFTILLLKATSLFMGTELVSYTLCGLLKVNITFIVIWELMCAPPDINLPQWSVQFGRLGSFLKDEHIGSMSNSRTLSPPRWDTATTTIHFLNFSQQLWQPPIYFLLLWIFLSSTFHIHWIKMWLCAWLFALCIIFASSSMLYSICFLSLSFHLRWPNNNLPNVYDHILFMQSQWLATCVISPSGQYKWFYSKHSGQVYKTMRCDSLGYVRQSKIAGS